MSKFKEASKLGLRFSTVKGQLSAEQLWGLSQADLSAAIKAVKKILKKTDDDELSFLEDAKIVDVENQLKFDILKEVYLDIKQEAEDRRTAVADKARRQKIVDLIADKKEESLRNLTVEELEKLL